MGINKLLQLIQGFQLNKFDVGSTVSCHTSVCDGPSVLEIRSKWWMDKCPSIIILGQTIISDLLGQILEHPNNLVASPCAYQISI